MASVFVTAVTIVTELCCYGVNKLYYVCKRNEGHSQWLWKGSMDIKNALKISPKSSLVAVLLTCIPAEPFKSILQQIKR